MFEKMWEVMSRQQEDDPQPDEPTDQADDRDAGVPVPVRRGPPDHGSTVAVAEPDDDEQEDLD